MRGPLKVETRLDRETKRMSLATPATTSYFKGNVHIIHPSSSIPPGGGKNDKLNRGSATRHSNGFYRLDYGTTHKKSLMKCLCAREHQDACVTGVNLQDLRTLWVITKFILSHFEVWESRLDTHCK